MSYVSAVSTGSYLASVSGAFQLKGEEQNVHVGISFSDPAIGSFKLHVGIQGE